MSYEDTTLKCRDCGQEFLYSAGEQEFFILKQFPAPVRCKECRQRKRARYTQAEK